MLVYQAQLPGVIQGGGPMPLRRLAQGEHLFQSTSNLKLSPCGKIRRVGKTTLADFVKKGMGSLVGVDEVEEAQCPVDLAFEGRTPTTSNNRRLVLTEEFV